MKLAIMQPYFFPYLGYFSLIKQSDKFIIFDTPQFMRKGWIERNRVIKLSGGSVYVKVPLVKAPLSTLINEMMIDNSSQWKDKIFSQLDIYKKKAPYYKQVVSLVKECLTDEFNSISKLNERILKYVCSYLGIETEIVVFSEMDIEVDSPDAPDEWALNICKSLGAKQYLNAAGGQSFFDVNKYNKNDIDLYFIEQPLYEYDQFGKDFEIGLSILDVMMFNSPEEIMDMLSQGSLIKAS
ncbi:MAG: hypothetical protein ACI9LM_004710 [Alteromonadaceae bacterium]|jgi:hypothetical protein